MVVTRKTVTAKTYGGYVNVSRQLVDFSNPSALDLVVNGLGQAYAIETEKAVGTALASTTTTGVTYGAVPTADKVAAAVWKAVATCYAVTKGSGRVMLAVAPDVLSTFGPLFPPVDPRSSQSPGLEAGRFNQGMMGTIGSVPCVMSAGIGTGQAYVFSTAALELFEQRVGMLQVVEPSVFGLQVAYAGYFSSLVVDQGAIIPLLKQS